MQIHELPTGTIDNTDKIAYDTGDHTYAVPYSEIKNGIIAEAEEKACVFTEATTRENINTGETRATIFGKIKKWFTDIAPFLTMTDVRSQITLTPSTNCAAVSVYEAYICGKILFIRFNVAPSGDIASPANNVDITFSGFTPRIANDFRLGDGIIGAGRYGCWLVSGGIIRCRYMTAATWASSNHPNFSGIIPIV